MKLFITALLAISSFFALGSNEIASSIPIQSMNIGDAFTKEEGDFVVTSVSFSRNVVYGTLENTTAYTARNIRLRAWISGTYQDYTYNGIVSSGSKIEVAVVLRNLDPDMVLHSPDMEILSYTLN